MSSRIVIRCDWSNTDSLCPQEFSIYTMYIEALRKSAVARGWVTRGDKDYCPTHKGTR